MVVLIHPGDESIKQDTGDKGEEAQVSTMDALLDIARCVSLILPTTPLNGF